MVTPPFLFQSDFWLDFKVCEAVVLQPFSDKATLPKMLDPDLDFSQLIQPVHPLFAWRPLP
jgi:hypothetical protein